jgi:integrase
MPRPATGSVVEPKGARKSWGIRFRAAGSRQFVSLGRPEDGWTKKKAEDELANTLAAVRLGLWSPVVAPEETRLEPEMPSFHAFAETWLGAREPELRPKTITDYRWSLEIHLLPAFKDHLLTDITAAEVDRFKIAKLAEGKIAPAQINKCLKRLAQILDLACDYELIVANPAASKGGRRRVKEPPPQRTMIQPEQLMSLLESAPKRHRPILALMAATGLRVGEACALDWRDIDLGSKTLTVQASKTPAGRRDVDLPDGLVTELWTLAATAANTAPGDPVFVSSQGTRQTPSNIGRRLKTAIRKANPKLEASEIPPLSERTSPHGFRRTFASIQYALGRDPIYVAQQGGWSDPGFPMKVYAQAVQRRHKLSGARLEEFDRALEWASSGAEGKLETSRQMASDTLHVEKRHSRAEN